MQGVSRMFKKDKKDKKHLACNKCNNPIEVSKKDNIVKCDACGTENPKK